MKNKLYRSAYLILIGCFALGQLGRIQLAPNLAVYGHDILIAIWLIMSLITDYRTWKLILKKIIGLKLVRLGGGIVIIGLLVAAYNQSLELLSALYLLRAISYLLFGLSLSWVLPKNLARQKLWVYSGLIILVIGLLQYFFLPDTRWLKFLGWDDHFYRLLGTHFDPNFTGIILVMTGFLLLGQSYLSNFKKIFWVVSLFVAILLTYSRATYLSFMISTVVLLGISLSAKQLLKWGTGLALGVMLGIWLLPINSGGEGVNLFRTYSITNRIQSNQGALLQIKDYEWLIGQGAFTRLQKTSDDLSLPNTAHFPDNLLVFVLSSTGLLGLSLFSYGIFKWGQWLYQNDKFTFSAFVAILIHSQFNHTLFQPFIWLWLMNLSLPSNELKSKLNA